MLRQKIIVISLENIKDLCVYKDCNLKFQSNHKILIIFHSLKNYNSYLIMQETGKFNLKVNVIPNGLEKYTSFNINNNLIVIDNFEFLSFSLDSFNKNLSKEDFMYCKFILVNQIGFYPYE